MALAVAGIGDAESLARLVQQNLPRTVDFDEGYLLTVEGSRGRLFALSRSQDAKGRVIALSPFFVRRLHRRPVPGEPRPGLPWRRPKQGKLGWSLRAGDAVVGVLYLGRRGTRPWTPDDRARLDPLGPVLASHLATALRIEETENRLYQLALVNAASRRMSATLEYQSLHSDVVTAIQSTFQLEHVVLYRVDRARGRAVLLAHAVRSGKPISRVAIPVERGLVGLAAKGETVVSNDVTVDRRYHRGPFGATRSELAIPLLAGGSVFGVLDLRHGEPNAFDRGTTVVLETLASQVANLLRNADQHARVEREAEKLRVLLETSRVIARSADSEDVLQIIADQAKALLRASGCTVYRLLPDGLALRPEVSREPRFNKQILGQELRVGEGIVGSVVRAGRPEVVNEASKDPRAIHVPGTSWSKMENLMVAPLAARGQLLGAMTLSRPRAHFTTEDLDLFTIFAGLAADSLLGSKLHREVRRTKDFLERLVESSADAIVTTDLQGRITLFSRGAEILFGYAASEVMGTAVSSYYVRGKEEGRRLMRFLRRHGRLANYEVQFVTKGGQPITCMMAASLLRDPRGQIIGTLGISKDITDRVRLERRLLELTIEDDLTGLFNQRHFWDSVGYETRRAIRQRMPLSLFLFDLDGFKRYNDRKGHLAGDAALHRVGRLLRSCVRSDIDKAFRYGGDEFVVLLPGAAVDVALRIAERVRRRVAAAFPGELSVSVGLVEMTEARTDARRFVRDADRAMYRAKREGGDRVEVA